MVVVDYYSRWIEILHLSNATTAACIAKLKDIFARFGIPTELVSHNAPQLSSSEFNSFAKQYGFTHVASTPYLPNANGKPERAVHTAKRILKQDYPWLGLMVYRDTVITATGCIPAQLMMGRHIRTTLPTLPTAIRPRWPNRICCVRGTLTPSCHIGARHQSPVSSHRDRQHDDDNALG